MVVDLASDGATAPRSTWLLGGGVALATAVSAAATIALSPAATGLNAAVQFGVLSPVGLSRFSVNFADVPLSVLRRRSSRRTYVCQHEMKVLSITRLASAQMLFMWHYSMYTS